MQENNELLLQYKNGDAKAMDNLLKQNEGLVRKIAGHYSCKCDGRIEFEDLLQEGYLGLMKAIEMFKIDKGFAFSTYAVYWIKQKMIRYLENNYRSIRIPSYAIQELSLIKKTSRELTQQLGKVPSVYKIASVLKMKPERVEFLFNIEVETMSLEETVSSKDDDLTVMDSIKDNDAINPEEHAIDSETRDEIKNLIDSSLGEDQKKVVRLRYGFDGECMTLESISKSIGKSRERIRQIEVSALRALRKKPYIIKMKVERAVEQRTNFYRKGHDPVLSNVIDREKERIIQTYMNDHQFYRWYNELLTEKYKMLTREVPYRKDRAEEIRTALREVDVALCRLVVTNKDYMGWNILFGRLNGTPSEQVKNRIPSKVNYIDTERKAIDFVRQYLFDNKIACGF